MSWLLANVDVVKVTLIGVAFVFYFLDVLLKGALRLFPETAGADLCLAAVSLDASFLLDRFDKITQVPPPAPNRLRAELYATLLLLLIGLVLWVICLRLVAPPPEHRLIDTHRSFGTFSHWLANLIGLSMAVFVILLFVGV